MEYCLNTKSTNENQEAKQVEKVIKFRLALTSFKHVGIFPEQASNWDYIAECVDKMKTKNPARCHEFVV